MVVACGDVVVGGAGRPRGRSFAVPIFCGVIPCEVRGDEEFGSGV